MNHTSRRQVQQESVQIPIKPSLGILGRKWTARILADIGFRGVDRFNQLVRSNPGLTRRLLSKRLRELEAEAIIQRRESTHSPREVRWSLAPKGAEMLPILMELLVFGSKWSNTYKFRGSLPTLTSRRPRNGIG